MRYCGRWQVHLWVTTYAPGQILVKMKSGMLCKLSGGFERPKAFEKVKPVSSEMYVVATKNAAIKRCAGCMQRVRDNDHEHIARLCEHENAKRWPPHIRRFPT